MFAHAVSLWYPKIVESKLGGQGETPPSSPSSAFYGFCIPATGMSRTDHDSVCRLIRQILYDAGSRKSRQHWRFIVDSDGGIRDVPWLNRDPDEISFRFEFEDVYDHLWREFIALNLNVPPPGRVPWDHEKWYAAQILAECQRQSRKRWFDWFKSCLSLCAASPQVTVIEIPPDYATHCHQQMSALKLWVEGRVADGSLLEAIRNRGSFE